MAAAKEMCIDATITALLFKLDGFFTLKEEDKNGTED